MRLEEFTQDQIRLVLRTAYRQLGDWDQARDAAQDVFVRALENQDRLDPSRPIEPWLYRVTVNLCRDRYRRSRPVEPLGEAEDPVLDPEQAAVFDEQRRLLMDAIGRLPDRERRAVHLREIEGFETDEVARILGTSLGTVRSQVARGRARLRQMLLAAGALSVAAIGWLGWRAASDLLRIWTPIAPPGAVIARMPEASLTIPRTIPRSERAVVRRNALPRRQQAPAEQVVVKFVSTDESVVIYWVMGTKGDN